ncbi:MAG TPA: hypothetical protein VGK05_07610 [Acidimicrobiia bacterium]|jgi:hypothetical protein
MPTDPFVPERLEEEPRQEPNLPPGVKMPAPRRWFADRPGDLPAGWPSGKLLGSPGPNIGYALTLANRVRDRFVLAPHEHVDDAVAVVAEIAMRRAALFGRAPVITDVELSMQILGYTGDADPDFVAWRKRAVHGAQHNYYERRALVDAIPVDILRLVPSALPAHLDEARQALRSVGRAPVE